MSSPGSTGGRVARAQPVETFSRAGPASSTFWVDGAAMGSAAIRSATARRRARGERHGEAHGHPPQARPRSAVRSSPDHPDVSNVWPDGDLRCGGDVFCGGGVGRRARGRRRRGRRRFDTRGELGIFFATVFFFLCGLALGRCSAGSPATRDRDGAAIVASVISWVAAAGRSGRVVGHGGGIGAQDGGGRERGQEHRGGEHREDAGDRAIGHTPPGHFVTRPLADRHGPSAWGRRRGGSRTRCACRLALARHRDGDPDSCAQAAFEAAHPGQRLLALVPGSRPAAGRAAAALATDRDRGLGGRAHREEGDLRARRRSASRASGRRGTAGSRGGCGRSPVGPHRSSAPGSRGPRRSGAAWAWASASGSGSRWRRGGARCGRGGWASRGRDRLEAHREPLGAATGPWILRCPG